MSLALAFAAAAAACTGPGAELSLSKQQASDSIPDVPVPPEDGPKLLVLVDRTPVFDRPSTAGKRLGDLRAGALVARSAEPITRKGCDAGWYAVRPRGFACAADPAALTPPVVPLAPDLTKPLPYRYGRARTEGVPVYARVPTRDEQLEAEPDLAKHLARLDDGDRELGAASNDVPIDARGVAKGPPVLLPGGEGVDAASRRPAGTYFVFDAAPPPVALPPAVSGLTSSVLRKNSGVALTSSFLAESDGAPRRFGVTPEGHLVPTDRLRPLLGTTWHGIDLEKIGLPVAFVHKHDAATWSLRKGEAEQRDEELERRVAVPLTGKFRTVEGVRYEEAREGYWLRSRDLTLVMRRTKFPDFAKGAQKWLDVSLATQTLTAYEGEKPLYATLISSGRDQLGDPAEGSAATARGTFRVVRKHVRMQVDTREVAGSFDLTDVPWAIEIGEGQAITGNYWSDPLGEAQGFHNVALGPLDARRIWTWADPQVPEGWNSYADDGGATTFVYVRP